MLDEIRVLLDSHSNITSTFRVTCYVSSRNTRTEPHYAAKCSYARTAKSCVATCHESWDKWTLLFLLW